jgi:O-antigen ligase
VLKVYRLHINLAIIPELLQILFITVTIFAYWHISPPIRDRYVWLLLLFIPLAALRLLFSRRLLTLHALLPLFVTFILLSIANYYTAPYQRSDYFVLISRPLCGIWLVTAFLEVSRVMRSQTVPLALTLGLALITGLLGLTATQWTTKSEAFSGLIALLPRLDHRAFLPDAQLSFNPNEIAGAMAWLCPLALGLAALPGRGRLWRAAFASAGLLLLLALFMGQSRFALAGVLGALGLLALGLASGWRRAALLAAIGGLVVAQALLVWRFPEEPSPTAVNVPELSSRDMQSVNTRLQMWQRSLEMVADYPLTGVGMSMYRTAIRTERYQIPYFESINFTAPHAHNEFLQIGADLGVGGWLWWLAAAGVIVWLLYRLYRSGTAESRVLSLALGAGFIAHAVYGLGDAITLWDRFAFVGWWLVALTVSASFLAKLRYNSVL